MSVFDLFRGFFGVTPGGHYRGRRDPFFDAMTHDEDDDEEEEEDGFYYDGHRGDQQPDPSDGAWRFGFSLGPDGFRAQEPPVFGQVLREMEEIFSLMGRWDGQPESGHLGVPSITPSPPSQDRVEKGGGGGSNGNTLRDFMFKTPDRDPGGPQPGLAGEPRYESRQFSKFHELWRQGLEKTRAEEHKGDRDLDSAVSSGGLDRILTPPAGETQKSQPKIRSFFQSVTVSKVVKPDGVRNGHIKRITDKDIHSLVLEVEGTNISTTYITCPADPRKTLSIKLPFLVMIVKNLKKYFTFEVQVIDGKKVRRRFRASNYQSTTRVKPFICTMPMRLDDGWNQIQFNLSDFTRRAYGTNYVETLRVQIHANCRIRRVYFSDRLYSEDELPAEFKLYLPVQNQKAKGD
ncbi:hypothetical protein F2P81_023363 [Scophthalmus maximus]|uniref:CFA20 domain-containing protein n=1 Tax=Scophthalmus maximus TaxID=52904 RepID=A0A6A4S039_SCOMX|nr:hypothetical protein F2P81_023363 [Scophthalmus maximus]